MVMCTDTGSYMLRKIRDLPFDNLKIRLGWCLNLSTDIIPCGGPRI